MKKALVTALVVLVLVTSSVALDFSLDKEPSKSVSDWVTSKFSKKLGVSPTETKVVQEQGSLKIIEATINGEKWKVITTK